MKKLLILFAILLIIPFVKANCACSCNESSQSNTTAVTLPEGYCNVSLTLQTDKTNYKNGEKILIYNELTDTHHNFTIDYWIENNNGSIIKKLVSTSNTNNKQYTTNFYNDTILVIKNNLTKLDCINVANNTYNELEIPVDFEESNISTISIDKIYNTKVTIGNNLTALISVYTGNNSEFNINTLIDNITSTQIYTIHGIYNHTQLNLTTQIPKDCNISTNNYEFTVSSTYFTITKNITIINNCINTAYNSYNASSNNITSNLSESVINLAGNPITGEVIYQSSNIKAKDMAIYMVMFVLALIAILVISTNKTIGKALKETTRKWSSQLEQ